MENEFLHQYSEKSFWEKIKNFSKSAGIKVVYAALLLYYVLEDKNVEIKTKLSITAALGYFIIPTDAIFDFTPLIGYSDDLGVLLFALSQISSNITPDVKGKARKKLEDWFGEIDDNELKELENKIG